MKIKLYLENIKSRLGNAFSIVIGLFSGVLSICVLCIIGCAVLHNEYNNINHLLIISPVSIGLTLICFEKISILKAFGITIKLEEKIQKAEEIYKKLLFAIRFSAKIYVDNLANYLMTDGLMLESSEIKDMNSLIEEMRDFERSLIEGGIYNEEIKSICAPFYNRVIYKKVVKATKDIKEDIWSVIKPWKRNFPSTLPLDYIESVKSFMHDNGKANDENAMKEISECREIYNNEIPKN